MREGRRETWQGGTVRPPDLPVPETLPSLLGLLAGSQAPVGLSHHCVPGERAAGLVHRQNY